MTRAPIIRWALLLALLAAGCGSSAPSGSPKPLPSNRIPKALGTAKK